MSSKTHYFSKIFWGAPPPTLYYCDVWLLLSPNFFNAKCRLNHPISQKFSWGFAPLAHQLYIILMYDYCCPTNFFNAKCRLEHPISQKFSEGQGCAPLAPQLCIIVMSDYYCPTNFFNAKCRLKHIISQKFSGGLRLPPSLANQRSFAPATCRVGLRAQNRKNLIFKWITEPSLWSYEMII